MLIKLSDPRIQPFSDEELAALSRRDLLRYIELQHQIREGIEGYVEELEEKLVKIKDQFVRIKSKIFGRSSEKSSKAASVSEKQNKENKPRSPTLKLPSERYPNAEIIDKDLTFVEAPTCSCCGYKMQDSGMVETSEHLSTMPKKIIIIRQHRHKYRCTKCHGDLVTTPPIPRVIPGSSYSDEMILDAALSKYCDLIPMGRYCQMAKRLGFEGLPPHSLISTTIKLAEFLRPIYQLIRQETVATPVLLADETPHRMLEGDVKNNWYLWGFLKPGVSCFYECHDTRSGDVAWQILINSSCEVLLTDVYSGYKKAVRLANEERLKNQLPEILMAYCNSHARRKFVTTQKNKPQETEYMLAQYKEIYKIDKEVRGQSLDVILHARESMRSLFEAMKAHAQKNIDRFPAQSWMADGFAYFLNNYEGLTLALSNPQVPIDNNASERMLRSHVVGRKTWYGTHSIDGAEAAAIHFSIIESCKINAINPRDYYKSIISALHQENSVLTPHQVKLSLNTS